MMTTMIAILPSLHRDREICVYEVNEVLLLESKQPYLEPMMMMGSVKGLSSRDTKDMVIMITVVRHALLNSNVGMIPMRSYSNFWHQAAEEILARRTPNI